MNFVPKSTKNITNRKDNLATTSRLQREELAENSVLDKVNDASRRELYNRYLTAKFLRVAYIKYLQTEATFLFEVILSLFRTFRPVVEKFKEWDGQSYYFFI